MGAGVAGGVGAGVGGGVDLTVGTGTALGVGVGAASVGVGVDANTRVEAGVGEGTAGGSAGTGEAFAPGPFEKGTVVGTSVGTCAAAARVGALPPRADGLIGTGSWLHALSRPIHITHSMAPSRGIRGEAIAPSFRLTERPEPT